MARLRHEVARTEELDRIEALPRRKVDADDAKIWSRVLTPEFLRPGASGALLPWQAYALAEAAEVGGAFLGYPVGTGKTLIAELMPRMLESKRSVLIVPASLREKTYVDRAEYAKTWQLGAPPSIVLSREELAREANAYRLEQIAPDLIIIDECDDLANPDSAAVRRIDRYVVERRAKGLPLTVVAMTGTPSRNSIMGYWHILCWCLDDGAPVPLVQSEAERWAGALDEKRQLRIRPGALGATVKAARAWYGSRLAETPGVILIDGDSCDAPLTVRTRIASECPDIDQHFERLLLEGENPFGIPVTDPLSQWRTEGQMGCGVVLRYNPPPPAAWAAARKSSARFCRGAIEASQATHRPIETEAQVYRRFADHPIVREWLAIRDTFTPVTEAVWLSDSVVEDARAWIDGDPDVPGIVWCGSVDFAERLAERTLLPYYSRHGKDRNGKSLVRADASTCLIASWQANKKGFNLQPWRRQLVVMPPTSAKWLEQMYGRSHRQGQRDPVTIDVLITSGGTLDGFEAAIREAHFARDTVRMSQKILRARVVRAFPNPTASSKYRWARKEQSEAA